MRSGELTLAVLVHDLVPLREPSAVGAGNHKLAEAYRDWLAEVAELASRFLVYSDYTRAELRNELTQLLDAAGPHRVEKFSLPHEHPAHAAGEVVRASVAVICRQDYVLCVGPMRGRKNGARLLEAWQLVRDEGDPAKPLPILAMAGDIKDSDIPSDRARQLGAALRIVRQPNDAEIAALYRSARWTVFPSLYEGWGLPIGESLWHGRFCLASNATSMPEVAGDLVDYFDPRDARDMARALAHTLEHPAYVAEREARIRRAALRSWADSARSLLRALEQNRPDRGPG